MDEVGLAVPDAANSENIIGADEFHAKRAEWIEEWRIGHILSFIEALWNGHGKVRKGAIKVEGPSFERFTIGIQGWAFIMCVLFSVVGELMATDSKMVIFICYKHLIN